jgi:hypothetical protein
MTFAEFEKFEMGLLKEIQDTNRTKGHEYTDGRERFHNFNEEAKDLDIDRLKVAEIFLNKHMRAIKAYIRNGKVSSNEPIRGRFVDAINYLILIAGMVEEAEKKGGYCGDILRPLSKKAE